MSDSNTPSQPLPRLAPRSAESHKGNFGRALIVGGSRGMAGAAALAGRSALRAGAGLVTIATADPVLETVAGFEMAYMTVPLPADSDGRIAAAARHTLEALLPRFDCVALGPGLGRSDELTRLASWLYQSLDKPLVVDADGLNALAAAGQLDQHAACRILTPHPGEFSRLTEGRFAVRDAADLERRREEGARFAADNDVTLVLKGHRTLITDGRRETLNTTGNPGLATGGSGDVLTGIILALLGQGLGPFEAAQLGVHVHGLAGDLAARDRGQVSLIASDLPEYLAAALIAVEGNTGG